MHLDGAKEEGMTNKYDEFYKIRHDKLGIDDICVERACRESHIESFSTMDHRSTKVVNLEELLQSSLTIKKKE